MYRHTGGLIQYYCLLILIGDMQGQFLGQNVGIFFGGQFQGDFLPALQQVVGKYRLAVGPKAVAPILDLSDQRRRDPLPAQKLSQRYPLLAGFRLKCQPAPQGTTPPFPGSLPGSPAEQKSYFRFYKY